VTANEPDECGPAWRTNRALRVVLCSTKSHLLAFSCDSVVPRPVVVSISIGATSAASMLLVSCVFVTYVLSFAEPQCPRLRRGLLAQRLLHDGAHCTNTTSLAAEK